MKRVLFVIGLLLVLCIPSKDLQAQYYFYNSDYYDNPVVFEVGGSLGVMNCLTDLGGKKGIGKKFVKDLNMGNTQFAGGVFVNASFKNAVTVRLEGTFGQVRAYDSILRSVKSTVYGRYERNLSFRSNITEVSALVELHPLYLFVHWEEGDVEPPKFSPYLVGGVGYFSFNPQAQLQGRWVDLQPLSTEGEGFKEYPDRKVYSLHQLNIPIGAGLRYELSPLFNLRAEFLYRILNTDYLDDVSTNYIDPTLYSNYFTGTRLTNALLLNDRQYELDPTHITEVGGQRGSPKHNDSYFTFSVKLGFIIGRERIRRH